MSSPSQVEKTGPTPAPTNKRLQQTQAQVNEVVDIMRINVDKVLERDKNLSKLDNRADALQAGASQFEASAGKLKRKFWWRNCKMLLTLGILATILIIVLIVWIVTGQKKQEAFDRLKEEHNKTIESLNRENELSSKSESGGTSGQEVLPNFDNLKSPHTVSQTSETVTEPTVQVSLPPLTTTFSPSSINNSRF